MRRFTLLLVILLCLATGSVTRADEKTQIEQTLTAHGVGIKPAQLVQFLQNGWRATKRPPTYPSDPSEKSRLLGLTWYLLSLHYADIQKDKALQPVLNDLALRYAQGALPPGALEIIETDIKGLPMDQAELRRHVLIGLLQYNGMVALGVFGEQSDTVRQVARRIYDGETSKIMRAAYAEALVLLGDNQPIDDLVALLGEKKDRPAAVAAAGALRNLFGRSFYIFPYTAQGPRLKAAQMAADWWDGEKKKGLSPQIVRSEVMARRLTPDPVIPPPLDSLRNLLRASGSIANEATRSESGDAWTRLNHSGEKLADDLEPFLKNTDEDLDIRQEAIRWYVRVKGDDARRRLKKLSSDPNPEIAELAKGLLETPPPPAE
ncbi:MAG TPA: hypothetical protein PLA90_04540 [Candidatus Sumerlaeota bacterium]|nr:hypothetical protein [Candidatus Sumerlaeota bacterium]